MTERQARKLYEIFTGKYSDKENFKIDIGDLNNLSLLGICTKIEYICKKEHLKDKNETIYFHDFKNVILLLANNEGTLILVSPDKKLKITDRGVIG